MGVYDPNETAKLAKTHWKSLKDEAGFDLRGVLRRRALVPFVLFPRHVAAHHNQAEKLSIYENLRQAHEAFVFGAPSAALALMRSTMEVVLRDHYGAQGDDLQLYERINNSRKLLPSSANAAALHRLRMIANAVLHLDTEMNEALPKLELVELEREILRLLRVLRDLIEGAPQRQQLRTQYGSHKYIAGFQSSSTGTIKKFIALDPLAHSRPSYAHREYRWFLRCRAGPAIGSLFLQATSDDEGNFARSRALSLDAHWLTPFMQARARQRRAFNACTRR